MYNLKRGLAVASMPIEQAIGYGLGAFLNNYFTRGNKKKGLEAAEAVISEPISSNEATSDGILSGIENKGSKESDILGDNSDYVRQVMETNASIPLVLILICIYSLFHKNHSPLSFKIIRQTIHQVIRHR